MSTLRAILLHMGLAAAQAGATQVSQLQNVYAQIAAQSALLVLQGVVASKNSKTDPNGKLLVERVSDNGYVTTGSPR